MIILEYMATTTLQRGTEHPTPIDLATEPTGTDLEPRRHPRRRSEALRSLARGRASDPAWVRPALLILLAVTATLYLWDLGASGWANSFYSAAVQAGTKSWKAFFFGSSDSSNFITVDKPPAALWVMEISARVFGLSSWSLLVPQALEGVAAVALVYATVRRWSTAGAGLLAGAVMALTPVAALMFRYNNPDALLVLVLCGAAYATTRAIDKASTRWLILAFSLVGLGFITKMMQAFLIVPALAGAYFLAAPTTLWARLRHLVAAGAAMLVSAGWWVVVVMAVPAADRPYIGGSQDNSLWNLIFGYNGFGRLTGNESGSVGGGAGTSGRWGPTGLTRLFGSEMGSQNLLAFAGGTGPAGHRLGDDPATSAYRPHTRSARPLGWVAPRYRPGFQPRSRNYPPLLHCCPGPCNSRHRRDRFVAALVPPIGPLGQAGNGWDRPGDLGVVDSPPRPGADMAP